MVEPTHASQPARRAETATAKGDVEVSSPSRTQTQLARRVAESRATVPDVTLFTEVDMEAALAVHPQIATDDLELAALVIRACSLALRAVPQANGAWRDARLERYSRVNVGFTVDADALVVPTVFDADRKSPAAIAQELRDLATRVRAQAVTAPELSGATFTVSALGPHGPRRHTAVIIPPQAGILAAGALTQRPMVHGGELAVRHGLDLTLSADHRVLYGAPAAQLLEHVRCGLQAPAGLEG